VAPRLAVTPAFADCRFDDIDLTDASVPSFEVIGGKIARIRADRLNATGTVLLRGDRFDPTYDHPPPPQPSETLIIAAGMLMCGAKIRGKSSTCAVRISAVAVIFPA